MSNLARQKLHFIKLRDFGAFQADISLLDTREVGAIDRPMLRETSAAASTGEALSGVWGGERPSESRAHFNPLAPGTVTIIPFPTPILPSDDGQPMYGGGVPSCPGGRPGKKKLAVRVAFTLLLFILLFKSVSWSTLVAILARVDPGNLLIAVTVGSVGTIVSAYQWRCLLHAEGISLDLARLINLYAVGIAFNHFLPTSVGGDVVKALYVGRESGNNAGSASAVVMSRITGFFGMLLVAVFAILIWHTYYAPNLVVILVLLSLLVGGMIGGTVLIVKQLPRIAQHKWAHSRVISMKFIAPAVRIGDALSKSARQPHSLCVSTLFGVLFHLVVSLNYYAYAHALHMDVPLYFYFVAIPLGTLVAFLPISINGFGVRESAFVYIFSTIHVPASTSLLLAFLMDLEVLFFGAVGGCIYLTMGEKRNSRGDPRGRPGPSSDDPRGRPERVA